MEYRKFNQLDIVPSLLGFGCMRFPTTKDGRIDEALSEKMIDLAIEKGVTYIDTAYPYHSGDSEPFVGRVLKKYKRESFYLATKLPIWKLEEKEDVEKIFYEQLERLQVDYVDFYLLHALDKARWEKVLSLGVLDFCENLKKKGKIRYLGFSFHDSYDVFEEILTYRSWDFCQIQFNYMDTEIQAGEKGYQLAEKLQIPMIVMEPVKGGALASLPEDIEKHFHQMNPKASLSSWALRWVASHSNVKVVLSGMSDYDQVLDNLNTFDQFKPLSEQEQQTVKFVSEKIRKRVKNGCTACKYCMPCPFGVNIPRNFAIWNELSMYGNKKNAAQKYFTDMKEEERADYCKKCGACETKCPQAILIRNDLDKVSKELKECKIK